MTTRLYVGGLGERVTDQDLRNTFSHLGSIETIDIIRTKGRSFAYINFLPSSENSLAKLFSTYNGCSWKGGKLKLEKAKEHYTDRLKREWAEDAEVVNSEDVNYGDVDENTAASLEPKSTVDLEKMQLRLFFPKLSKVKSLPLRGTGKHKYSFQRVVVPPLPVHFCDCPEHCNDIQSGEINDTKVSMVNSVLNRGLSKGTSLTKGSKLPSKGAQLDDSRIQDDGINEEEIQVMNSVMKRLLDRENAKREPKEFQDSPRMTAPTFEVQEDQDNEETDDDDDDDDIKINTGAGPNAGSESWETSLVNKMLRSNEQRTSEESAKSKLGTQNLKVKSSNKKRKSVSNDSNENDPASHIPKKKVHFQLQSKESKEPLNLTSVAESETKKLNSSGMWSQKSSWKELVGDGSSGSFQLSSHGVTNNDEKPTSTKEVSTDSKEYKKIIRNEENKPSINTMSDSNEVEKVVDPVLENLDGQSKEGEEVEVAQPTPGPTAGVSESAKGSCWMQKSPWTQLIGESSSFSISQVLPRDVLETQKLSKSTDTVTNFYSSGVGFGGTQISSSGLPGEDKKKDARPSAARGINLGKASKGNNHSDSTISKKSDQDQKASDLLPGVAISDTCPFMRNADSLKDWQTAKAALTGALKRRNNKQASAS